MATIDIDIDIEVFNRQDSRSVDLDGLKRFAERALPRVQDLQAPESPEGESALAGLRKIEVTIVSDESIAAVHEEFMQVTGPTDVITFDHGEIVISADTAEAAAGAYATTRDAELALYLLHGLLHLRGYDDRTPPAAAEMRAVQEGLFAELWNGEARGSGSA